MSVRFPKDFAVQILKDRVDDFIADLESLLSHEVLVGIPASSAARAPEKKSEFHSFSAAGIREGLEKADAARAGRDPAAPVTIDNATLGYIHEHGAPSVNIPARPFLVPGVQQARDQITKVLSQGVEAVTNGNRQAAMNSLDKAGLIAQNAVRRKITEGPFVPLKPRTLAARRARGRTGEKPLIDTGQLRRSITYVVRETEDDG